MARKIIIACLVVAGFLSGCQEQISSAPPVEVNQVAVEPLPAPSPCPCLEQTSSDSETNSPTVIAYYFHRTLRCPTCLAIEANAQRVIENEFENQIANNRLIWLPFNLDEPGSEEFEKEFDVSASTLVLAKRQDGKHTNYKKIEKVWDFIGDPVKFDAYLQGEVETFLDESFTN